MVLIAGVFWMLLFLIVICDLVFGLFNAVLGLTWFCSVSCDWRPVRGCLGCFVRLVWLLVSFS